MNEERTAIINMAMEGRLDTADARALLDALWTLEMEEEFDVEPPCREPPWVEGTNDPGDLLGGNDPSLLPNASRQIARALPDANRRLIAPRLAALDVMYLGGFRPTGDRIGVMYGGFTLARREGALRFGDVTIVTNYWIDEAREPSVWAMPMAHWLFKNPIELAQPAPRRAQASARSASDLLAAVPEAEPITTGLGTFAGCLKVECGAVEAAGGIITGPPAATRAHPRRAGWTLWLAPGVGPVRVRCRYFDGTTADTELDAYRSAGGDDPFPLDPGNWWRFERPGTRGAGARVPFRELWRALAPERDGSVWLSAAAQWGPRDAGP